MPHPAPHLAEHAPLLTPGGYDLLRRMTEHPHAPTWNTSCGDRLRPGDPARVDRFREALAAGRADPERIAPTVRARVLERRDATPIFRERLDARTLSELERAWASVPTTDRADLAARLADLVPDDADLSRMIVYSTSGTTGHAIQIPSDPVASACYLPLLEAALAARGVVMDPQPDTMMNALLCAQQHTATHASILTPWREAGHVKINLAPGAWHAASDTEAFLADFAPPLLTGDPFSFARAAELDIGYRPAALVSTATALTDGLRDALEARFGCPVLDWYSLNETGPIAVACPLGHGRHILPHDILVEVVRPDGTPAPDGERGEITVTGGRNPFLPLLRYRTGDHARLDAGLCPCGDPMPRLIGLEGRAPVYFESAEGAAINPVDVSRVLRPLPLVRHRLEQHADRSCTLLVDGSGESPGALEAALRSLFGSVPIRIERGQWKDGAKVVPYESALTPAPRSL